MEEHKSVIATCEGDQHVVAAAQHILKALAASKAVSDDLRKTLLDFEIHLSAISRVQSVNERNGRGIKQLEKRLQFAKGKVTGWEANHDMIWDSGPKESSDFLEVVGEIQTLTQSLQNMTVNDNLKPKELLRQADGVLQIAMSKLEEELVHILVKHKQYFEPEFMSLHSNRVDVLCDESFGSVDDEQVEALRSRNRSQSEASTVDLVNPAILPDLKSIANVMFASKYHQEFCHAFVNSRRDALDEYFVILEMEKLSIENVLKMEWHCLNREMKKWIRAVKIVVQVYLVSEKRLCKQILGDFGSVHHFCFSEISRSFMLHLLNFGEAIAMGTHTPEKLFQLLDMYEVLDQLTVYVDILFFEEVGSFVRGEFHKLLRKLGDTVRSTFLAFGNAIATNPSKDCFPGGGVHHVTKYVMNYIKVLAEYGDTLNLLLADETPIDPAGNDNEPSALSSSPLALHFRAIAATLESNLSDKSKLYREVALQHIFTMNNIHYMVEKVKTSELRHFFGDFWLRQHVVKFRHESRSYERAAWGPVLSIIRDDSKSNCVSEATLKKKCKEFSAAFAEIYRSQTGWLISDPGLRDDLQISISQSVVHAYRQYTGRHSSNIDEKWNKYTADDIESYILDLFEGASKSLHHHQQQRK